MTVMTCRSGLVSRKGCAAAPTIYVTCTVAGAAAQPFRDTRPLLQGAVLPAGYGKVAPFHVTGLRCT
ncbi:hypothetical protein EI693_17170 [Pseudomonas oryziphila]|uniref:Uncharacterized protein n=1 Tax=Pseudomonas oryziphila TaxID=2894079 RepID=A0ABN5THW2_9PSED|nr:hypothetical protein EI693_17170 [Pseudomonas oryziphila]